MKNEQINETETAPETAPETAGDGQGLVPTGQQAITNTSFDLTKDTYDIDALSNEEKVNLQRRIIAARAAVKAVGLPMRNSGDILGLPVHILDAAYKAIPVVNKQTNKTLSKICVDFLMEDVATGEKFTCMKNSNTFNNVYPDYFNEIRGALYAPLFNYRFVEDARWKVGSNVAHVLQEIQETKTVGKLSK